jgi:meso-butanediol dehydrogenase / (S,S)-butanediol dehydrogenase / diacetyl reductase
MRGLILSPKGKVVLVAGVGAGLGAAVVSLLGASGATVIGLARSRTSLDALEKHAQSRGWSFQPATADMRLQADVTGVVDRVLREFGRLDGVSINVGHWVQGDTLLHLTTEEEWSTGLHDNLDAVHRIGRAALPAMIKQGHGSVVLVSATEHVRHVGSPSYCVAKGGLLDLTKKLAADYRLYGIRFNAVLPGNMERRLESFDPPEEGRNVPLRDNAGVDAWQVARAIRYLLLDEGEWVTGALLTVDGGQSTGGTEPSN